MITQAAGCPDRLALCHAHFARESVDKCAVSDAREAVKTPRLQQQTPVGVPVGLVHARRHSLHQPDTPLIHVNLCPLQLLPSGTRLSTSPKSPSRLEEIVAAPLIGTSHNSLPKHTILPLKVGAIQEHIRTIVIKDRPRS